ncbi:hypothetical protein pEaSNUABM11_00284 [Erwinia phage pEa_SNUABM_11]|nr:hypothetical protein pEaSNUABM11_00284 [Erwinia phage pEa_SNUABM_11]
MQLKNPEFRKEFMQRLGAIVDANVAAYKGSVDDEAFAATTNFPAEVIPHTVNGYQRFLNDNVKADSRATVLSGFLINLTAHLKIEFGKELLKELQEDIFGANRPTETANNQNTNALSLWALAYQQYDENTPPADFNAMVSYLFLQRSRWLLTQAKVEEMRKE